MDAADITLFTAIKAIEDRDGIDLKRLAKGRVIRGMNTRELAHFVFCIINAGEEIEEYWGNRYLRRGFKWLKKKKLARLGLDGTVTLTYKGKTYSKEHQVEIKGVGRLYGEKLRDIYKEMLELHAEMKAE